MKRNWKSISLLLITLFLAACKERPKQAAVQQEQPQAIYTCPMHPQVHEDHPGNCPICGMTLVKKTASPSEQAGISLQTVLQPVNGAVVSDIQAVMPTEKTIIDTVSASGYLAFDTRTYNNIAARFSGRIEKLYIKYAFQEIHKGQRIMDVYSPEMVTAQQDLLFLQRNSPGETALIDAARQKLSLLGMTGTQLRELSRTGKAFYSLPVYSPYEGHVHDVAHSQMAGAAVNEANDYAQNMPLAVKEGMFVQQGQTLFNVVDPHSLWAELKIKQTDAEKIKLLQSVSLNIPDQQMTMEGKVDFIEPVQQNDDRSTSIRVYLNNHQHEMKVGSLVRAEIAAGSKAGLWLPRTAVISLGQSHIVWLKDGRIYRAHVVQTGTQNGEQVQVLSGLTAQDSVAQNAQYLADSDSFIKTEDHE
ncbi:Cu(I)/Ag(I) efflux system membrane fusion protein [Mucilaginibacter yixingensis]|uniref:Cu(I)/Ag(I) efflux system membrane fusion protein n=1 Tax=Mucilaginibacter yixingensis TaxID=1295612 RepID=A0A2T5JDA2_9SPHI|nr:efflux RND transporter periplasmic adaptor subunit [Mucilaginibacter yixingensis]PTQ99734.1 Cu(I)/Ag(I) efflux system membrane fusion protein [Mucilaginibacter yixingensis]